MMVCEADDSSDRRYEFIQYESGLVYGQKGICSNSFHNVESWHRWIFWRCSYCLCLCDDTSDQSDRFFSLRPVLSDVQRNRVVTGVQFVKRNRIFHLQIQEGVLLPHGIINHTEWKPVDEFKVSGKGVWKDIDYHELSYKSRSIDLDEVKVENNSVVTGLRFQVVGTHLNLQARFSEIDFESGQLRGESFWKLGGGDQPRQKLHLESPNVPTRSNSTVPLSSDNQYIDFINTGFKDDAAQTTVPFIDIQEVTSDSPVPLSGIGIYYKGLHGYGGFLAPKLITYDYSPYIQVPTWAPSRVPDEKTSSSENTSSDIKISSDVKILSEEETSSDKNILRDKKTSSDEEPENYDDYYNE
ncbi:uncharacterized protein LOC119556699 isoform X2 [Drosophila subpulchrella]|nr:uncharacterized protein LOC119556699 isoform X2 [Drosophila subpulchrella]